MSIRRVTCPQCGTTANVPAAMASVKCPSCGTVWNANDSSPAPSSPAPTPRAETSPGSVDAEAEGSGAALLAGLVAGGMLMLAMIGLLVFLLGSPGDATQVSAEPQETIKPATPEPYREIDLPEETRRRIYNDYRKMARTTVEQPLLLPQGGAARASLEDMLQKTHDRELMHFAALHDITVDDVKEVIKEGDAKVWDDSPRSNAVRDGKRVYPKEMSEGWQRNPNQK